MKYFTDHPNSTVVTWAYIQYGPKPHQMNKPSGGIGDWSDGEFLYGVYTYKPVKIAFNDFRSGYV